MPRGFGLSEVTKDGIWELRAKGLSDREIGRRLGLPRGSVSNHLARTGGTRSSGFVLRSFDQCAAGKP
jgi:hypothetical protein